MAFVLKSQLFKRNCVNSLKFDFDVWITFRFIRLTENMLLLRSVHTRLVDNIGRHCDRTMFSRSLCDCHWQVKIRKQRLFASINWLSRRQDTVNECNIDTFVKTSKSGGSQTSRS